MARTNMTARRIKPAVSELLTPRVMRRERISAHFVRVTFGGAEVERFQYLGFDQWFRLFIPIADGTLSRLPHKLSGLAYAKYLAIEKASRPLLRNYSVRAFRPDGPDWPEFDVDFVLHGSAADGTAGPAASWAETCQPGDEVAMLDEGVMFNPGSATSEVLLVTDESGLPAAAGILASLPSDVRGAALIELPADEDKQDLIAPAGVAVTWVTRDDPAAVPGRAVLATAQALPVPSPDTYCWTVGEQTLPTSLRRHWVRSGVPKEHILFCGYWKHAAAH